MSSLIRLSMARGSSLSREPRPQRGSAAKPRTPEGAAVSAAGTEAQRPSSRLSHAGPGKRGRARPGAAYGGTTEAMQADGLGEASGAAAVAASAARAAGPQRPLDPTSRYGAGTAAAAPGTSRREREAARPGGGGACALRRPRPVARP
uniref:RIKEN cDNA 3110021N24 gene n=1 Tax=Mus spicilegus TaxID=10103 RepID=A0A8C6GTL5_MUSSI